MARELSRPLKVLIASQPTRGVDVGSIEFIHKRIIAERDNGTAVIIVSTELDEIFALADRIAVMYDGRIVGIVTPDTTRERDRPDDGRRLRPRRQHREQTVAEPAAPNAAADRPDRRTPRSALQRIAAESDVIPTLVVDVRLDRARAAGRRRPDHRVQPGRAVTFARTSSPTRSDSVKAALDAVGQSYWALAHRRIRIGQRDLRRR